MRRRNSCSKKYSGIVALIFTLLCFYHLKAQDADIHYKNRIQVGLGGEDGYLGIDYARDIYKSKLFVGIGCGLGTGWTLYTRYEPFTWHGLGPFISAGVSHSFGGTLIVSPGTSVLSASTGINYLLKVKWRIVPTMSIGMSYYYKLTGDAEGGMNGFGPLIKVGVAFPKSSVKK